MSDSVKKYHEMMEDKKSMELAEELIQKRLFKRGITQPCEISESDQLSTIMSEYGCSIVNDWQAGCDAFFYAETTADDYEVFVACTEYNRVNLNEDVYYYAENWFEKLADYLREGFTVYVEKYWMDEYAFQEVLEALYEDYYMEQYNEVENELIDEGYEYEKQ